MRAFNNAQIFLRFFICGLQIGGGIIHPSCTPEDCRMSIDLAS
jgi:hypothetical protein